MDSTSPSPPPPPPASRPARTRTRTRTRARARAGACAACKFQQRRCKLDCPLAAAFPADQAQRFANAHRLFGVRKIERIVEGLDPRLRAKALETVIFESEVRAVEPIGGCCRLTRRYEAELERITAELALVQSHLAVLREQTMAESVAPSVPAVHDPCDDLEMEAMPQMESELARISADLPLVQSHLAVRREQTMAESVAPSVPAVHDPCDDLEMEAMPQMESELARISADRPLVQSHLAVRREQTMADSAAPFVPAVHDPWHDLEMEAMHQILLDFQAETADGSDCYDSIVNSL